jgi:hypothetical protein
MIVAIFAAAGLLWYGLSPWIVAISTKGATLPKFGFGNGAALFFAMSIGGLPLGGWLFHAIGAIIEIGVLLGVPIAIMLTRSAISAKGAADLVAVQGARASAKAAYEQMIADLKKRGPVADLAKAQGVLASRNHSSAMRKGEHVMLSAAQLFTGLAVIGPSGIGKTACIAQPLAGHWLDDNRAGLFAPGIKRSWSEMLTNIALAAGRSPEQIHRIGPGHGSWALIKGLTPLSVSGFFLDALGAQGDQYWPKAAASVVGRVAGIIYNATSDGSKLCADVTAENGEVLKAFTLSYDLRSIATLAYARGNALEAIVRAARAKAEMLRPVDKRAAESIDLALESHERVMDTIPEKQWGSVVSQLDAVIDPFVSDYDLANAFTVESDFDIHCLEGGEVCILDCDLSKYGPTSAFVFGLARAQLKQLMLEREPRAENGEPVNAILYLQDEYASYAGKDDDDLLRLCRAAKIAPVMLYQSQSILEKEVGKDSARAIVGAALNKIIFRTDDYTTVELLIQALGQADVEYTSTSETSGFSTGSGGGSNHGTQGGGNSSWNSGSSHGTSTSKSMQQRNVVDQQLIQNLKKHLGKEIPRENAYVECVFVGEIGTSRVADVVRANPWSPPKRALPEVATLEVGETLVDVHRSAIRSWS